MFPVRILRESCTATETAIRTLSNFKDEDSIIISHTRRIVLLERAGLQQVADFGSFYYSDSPNCHFDAGRICLSKTRIFLVIAILSIVAVNLCAGLPTGRSVCSVALRSE